MGEDVGKNVSDFVVIVPQSAPADADRLFAMWLEDRGLTATDVVSDDLRIDTIRGLDGTTLRRYRLRKTSSVGPKVQAREKSGDAVGLRRPGGLRWRRIGRASLIIASVLFFVGLVAMGGRGAGAFVTLSGAAITLSAVIVLFDLGGAGTDAAATYQQAIQRRIRLPRPPDPSQRVVWTRFVGALGLIIGMGFALGGLGILAGLLSVP